MNLFFNKVSYLLILAGGIKQTYMSMSNRYKFFYQWFVFTVDNLPIFSDVFKVEKDRYADIFIKYSIVSVVPKYSACPL